MAREIGSPEKQAEFLKDQGNQYFKKGKLGAAIEAYTQVCLDVTFTILDTWQLHFDLKWKHLPKGISVILFLICILKASALSLA